ncbi:hypothetical protein [Crocosphaera chwakensis]|uniref:Uncharacterized protein n=1 Tax=Crocosphaera chwakensis CCY0110 TaxID=391612 RepID=A3IZ57_9CHRO|nr:hypothetical protein [Crocosphaera chwakensis]EAZ88227.1 hypothetical protein CY0110_01225 [Crocosphaera chwakensis CCY0110]
MKIFIPYLVTETEIKEDPSFAYTSEEEAEKAAIVWKNQWNNQENGSKATQCGVKTKTLKGYKESPKIHKVPNQNIFFEV